MRQPLILALAVMAVTAGSLSARVIAPAPIPDRVARAQCIVVGKVTEIEKKNVMATALPGSKDQVEYQVAVVKVDDLLAGPKGLTNLRIGFQPQGGPRIRFPQLNLTVGQEACFFLTRHHEQPFYVVTMYFDVVNKKDNANFDKEVALAKRCTKLLADPEAGLTAKSADDRLLTAAMLVRRCTWSAGSTRREPIDAKQSKQILETLADADWSKTDPETRVSAQTAFLQLGLTPKDGWSQPQNFQELPAAAKKWLKGNADKYRIQRYVAEKNDKK